MKDKEAPFEEWVNRLSSFYEASTITRYYRRYKHSETELYKLYLTKHKERVKAKQFKRKLQSILMKRAVRDLDKLSKDEYSGIGTIRKIQNVKKAGGSYEIHKSGDDISVTLSPSEDAKPLVIHIEFGDKEKRKFEKFFNGLDYYFTYAKGDVDIIRLEDILKKYYEKVLKIKALKSFINKKSIYDENEAIEELLNAARNLLYINNDKLYRSIPKTLSIQSIKEITAETISELVQLDIKLHKHITYAKVLEDLRDI